MDEVTTQLLQKERDIDVGLLRWAFEERRVIATHDKKTFPGFTYDEIIMGRKTFGVIVVPTDLGIGKAIDDLELLIISSREDEFVNQVIHLPIR